MTNDIFSPQLGLAPPGLLLTRFYFPKDVSPAQSLNSADGLGRFCNPGSAAVGEGTVVFFRFKTFQQPGMTPGQDFRGGHTAGVSLAPRAPFRPRPTGSGWCRKELSRGRHTPSIHPPGVFKEREKKPTRA